VTDILGQIGTKVGNYVSDRFEGLTGNDNYSEITYASDGNISKIETYVDATKAVLLKVKTFTFTTGSLTQIVVTDGVVTKLTQTLAYDSSGNLESIGKDYA
jgi:alpha-N-acetylglucosamine transferase